MNPGMSDGVRCDIVMLAGENPTSWIVYNRLVSVFGPFHMLVENHVSRRKLIANRIRKLGFWSVASQVAFVFLIRPCLNRRGRRRIAEISQTQALEATEPAGRHIRNVGSVNSPACREALKNLNPKVVIVNGTRIISREILESVPGVFLNVHQGITPHYRGAHGAYWALHEADAAHCGVTVHIVDEGVDTGGIVDQAIVSPTAADTFVTYPYLQTAAALPGLVAAVEAALAGELQSRQVDGPSAVWYHPGFFQYLKGRLRGVR